MPASRLIFLGPPGSGKGTQAQRLAASLGLVHLSSGDVLRKEIRDGSDVGQRAAAYYNRGVLVPDEVVSRIMAAAVKRLPAGSGLVLDGFPRTVPQAEVLERDLAELHVRIDAVLDFRLDDAAIVQRISGRRICSRCDALYNAVFFPPKQADVCDRCGGALLQRADDREDVVMTRLATYRKLTAPLVEYYASRGMLHAIDAGRSADEVEAATRRVIASLGAAR
jgi:adenylate kinase